jgi:hypothetical protein
MKRRVALNAPSIKYGAKGDLDLSTIRRKTYIAMLPNCKQNSK